MTKYMNVVQLNSKWLKCEHGRARMPLNVNRININQSAERTHQTIRYRCVCVCVLIYRNCAFCNWCHPGCHFNVDFPLRMNVQSNVSDLIWGCRRVLCCILFKQFHHFKWWHFYNCHISMGCLVYHMSELLSLFAPQQLHSNCTIGISTCHFILCRNTQSINTYSNQYTFISAESWHWVTFFISLTERHSIAIQRKLFLLLIFSIQIERKQNVPDNEKHTKLNCLTATANAKNNNFLPFWDPLNELIDNLWITNRLYILWLFFCFKRKASVCVLKKMN